MQRSLDVLLLSQVDGGACSNQQLCALGMALLAGNVQRSGTTGGQQVDGGVGGDQQQHKLRGSVMNATMKETIADCIERGELSCARLRHCTLQLVALAALPKAEEGHRQITRWHVDAGFPTAEAPGAGSVLSSLGTVQVWRVTADTHIP
eukprot:1196021-Prymnesium_polylepis.3